MDEAVDLPEQAIRHRRVKMAVGGPRTWGMRSASQALDQNAMAGAPGIISGRALIQAVGMAG
jgi:hypothetical protein